MPFLYILGTIIFTVYGQLILKWRISKYGVLPENIAGKMIFLAKLLFDPFVFSGLAGAFIGALFWMAAMTKLQLSYAYPFVGLTFVLVMLFSSLFFKEPITQQKIVGMSFIVIGIIISSMSL